ncbi:hypothetical protein LXL04_006731 [Taraxacum kok-saghyz]
MGVVEQAHNVKILGSGNQTIVLAHGFGTDQSVWKHLVPHLVDDYKVVLYDNMGAGTTNPEYFDFDRYATLEGFAYDVIGILEELRVSSCIYVGHSVSAMIGAVASITRPDLFSKILMISASPRLFVNKSIMEDQRTTRPISSFLSSPRFFNGLFSPKTLQDSQSSPTLILDANKISVNNPFEINKNRIKPTKIFKEIKTPSEKFDHEGIALALVVEQPSETICKPNTISRKLLFTSNLKIQIPKLPTDYGIKTRSSQFFRYTFFDAMGFGSPRGFTGRLSLREIELSEEYTRNLEEGANRSKGKKEGRKQYLNDVDYFGGFEQEDLDQLFQAMESNFKAWCSGFAPLAVGGDMECVSVQEFSRTLFNMRPDIALSVAQTIFQSDMRHLLCHVTVPCHIIQSMKDLAVPVVVSEYLHQNIGGESIVEVMSTEGHLPQLSSPDVVVPVLLRHIRCDIVVLPHCNLLEILLQERRAPLFIATFSKPSAKATCSSVHCTLTKKTLNHLHQITYANI